MKLSKLETDFIGDVAQSPHDLWELYQFIRHHHPDMSEQQTVRMGRELVAAWVARGWLMALPESTVSCSTMSEDDILKFVDRLGRKASMPGIDTIRLSLTEKAYQDIDWLNSEFSRT